MLEIIKSLDVSIDCNGKYFLYAFILYVSGQWAGLKKKKPKADSENKKQLLACFKTSSKSVLSS